MRMARCINIDGVKAANPRAGTKTKAAVGTNKMPVKKRMNGKAIRETIIPVFLRSTVAAPPAKNARHALVTGFDAYPHDPGYAIRGSGTAGRAEIRFSFGTDDGLRIPCASRKSASAAVGTGQKFLNRGRAFVLAHREFFRGERQSVAKQKTQPGNDKDRGDYGYHALTP
jgi:hypothetical protein